MNSDKYNIQTDRSGIDDLPDKPGVYRLHGRDKELLYVGKSVNVNRRVSEHLRHTPQTRASERLRDEAKAIQVNLTAGELGAAMLELHFIKQLQPILNKQSRKKKRVVTATEGKRNGYLYPNLSRTESIDTDQVDSLLGVFKSRSQAKEIIAELAQKYKLCQRRLQISTAKTNGACFYYQLDQCRGACVGEERPGSYNRRFRNAFASYSVATWPFDGPIAVTESTTDRVDQFVIDQWRLVSAKTKDDNTEADFFPEVAKIAGFNHDVYKCLAKHIVHQNDTQLQAVKTSTA